MKLAERAESILREYNFGRFDNLTDYAENLRKHFEPYPDGNCGCESTLYQFAQLDSRFKRVLDWAQSSEGQFPRIWTEGGHLNFLPAFGRSRRLFYQNAPENLKIKAVELYRMHGESIREDSQVERVIDLSRVVLDEGFDYISRLLDGNALPQ
jgi:hypothetical protein